MKIAVISDIHDNIANLDKFLEVFDGPAFAEGFGEAKGIICCGDVTTPETLEWLAEKFVGPIKLVCGNMEIRRKGFAEVAKRHKNLEVFEDVGEWEIEGLKIAFVHQPDRVEELALRQAQGKPKYNFVFYGHTHKPWIKEIMANPGTLGGVFTFPTFAILDTETGHLELKKLY